MPSQSLVDAHRDRACVRRSECTRVYMSVCVCTMFKRKMVNQMHVFFVKFDQMHVALGPRLAHFGVASSTPLSEFISFLLVHWFFICFL